MQTKNRQERKEESKENFDEWQNFISLSKTPYKVILSNYVQQIESDFLNFKSSRFFL
jgi:aspartyl aminopeptidase